MFTSSNTLTNDQTNEDTQVVVRVAYETMQFFEINLPEGADPETYCNSSDAREHFADLILSGFIDFKLKRKFGEDGEEV